MGGGVSKPEDMPDRCDFRLFACAIRIGIPIAFFACCRLPPVDYSDVSNWFFHQAKSPSLKLPNKRDGADFELTPIKPNEAKCDVFYLLGTVAGGAGL